jgi:hypothetical protein
LYVAIRVQRWFVKFQAVPKHPKNSLYVAIRIQRWFVKFQAVPKHPKNSLYVAIRVQKWFVKFQVMLLQVSTLDCLKWIKNKKVIKGLKVREGSKEKKQEIKKCIL